MSVIFRLTVLIASFRSMLRIWRLTSSPLSVSSSSVSIRSSISGALICRKDTAQNLSAIVNFRASPKRKEEGAIKSWTDRPEGASQLHSKANRSPSGCRMPWSISSHSLPPSSFARAPMTLKWLRASMTIRENRARAVLLSRASMVRVRYFVLIRPLLPRSSCLRSICV